MPGRACSSATVWEVNRRALAMAPPAPSPTPRPPAFLSGALNDTATRARLAKLDHDREVRADRNVFRAQLLCQLDILNRRIRRLPGSRARRDRAAHPSPSRVPPPETADAADAAGIARVARARVERAARDADRAFRRDAHATLDRLERDALVAELHARDLRPFAAGARGGDGVGDTPTLSLGTPTPRDRTPLGTLAERARVDARLAESRRRRAAGRYAVERLRRRIDADAAKRRRNVATIEEEVRRERMRAHYLRLRANDGDGE